MKSVTMSYNVNIKSDGEQIQLFDLCCSLGLYAVRGA